jgi:hypothetical protein
MLTVGQRTHCAHVEPYRGCAHHGRETEVLELNAERQANARVLEALGSQGGARGVLQKRRDKNRAPVANTLRKGGSQWSA